MVQDHDGSHIKGLIMNYFHHFYPSLLKLPGFLVEFITPIIKVCREGRGMPWLWQPASFEGAACQEQLCLVRIGMQWVCNGSAGACQHWLPAGRQLLLCDMSICQFTSCARPCQLLPCMQATKGKESISFYTLPEYEEWRESHNTRGWTIKYYKVDLHGGVARGAGNEPAGTPRQASCQSCSNAVHRMYMGRRVLAEPVHHLATNACSGGCNPCSHCSLTRSVPISLHPAPPPKQGLGTSTAAEAKQYFANIQSHRKEFVWDGAHCCYCPCLFYLLLLRLPGYCRQHACLSPLPALNCRKPTPASLPTNVLASCPGCNKQFSSLA